MGYFSISASSSRGHPHEEYFSFYLESSYLIFLFLWGSFGILFGLGILFLFEARSLGFGFFGFFFPLCSMYNAIVTAVLWKPKFTAHFWWSSINMGHGIIHIRNKKGVCKTISGQRHSVFGMHTVPPRHDCTSHMNKTFPTMKIFCLPGKAQSKAEIKAALLSEAISFYLKHWGLNYKLQDDSVEIMHAYKLHNFPEVFSQSI